MIVLLLITTFVIALVVASIVVWLFGNPIQSILSRVVPLDLSPAWAKYLKFAIYVVGIGGGVRPWDLEKYMTAVDPYRQIVEVTPERWVLEIYQTIIGTLQSTAMVLLVFFVFALIAVVMVQIVETRSTKTEFPRGSGAQPVR